MNENGFLKEKRQPLLSAAGILSVAAGLVLVYFGFLMLMDSNSAITPELTQAERKVIRYISLGGIYLMANGIYSMIAGFYGAVNSGVSDCMMKCKKMGWILIAFSIMNVIILSVLTDIAGNKLNMVIVFVPIIISIMYCVGNYLNISMIKKRQQCLMGEENDSGI